MAPPWDPGEPAAEPSAIEGVAIAEETLVLDLRPVAELRPARVTARYQIQNDGPERTANLVFVSPGAESGSVSIDGQPLAVQPLVDAAALPESWRPPGTVPGIDGRPVQYIVQGAGGVAFQVSIPVGRHEIVVAYDVEPGAYHGGSGGTRHYQLAYTLAPARSWDSFGALDLTVEVPAGWEAVASLPLARAGSTLHGRFDGVPADSIGLTVRPPQPLVLPLGFGAVVAGSVLVAFVGYRLGRRTRGWGTAAAFGLLVLLAFVGAIIVAVISGVGVAAEQSMGGPHVARGAAYNSVLFVLAVIALGGSVGLFAAPIALLVGRQGPRRGKPAR